MVVALFQPRPSRPQNHMAGMGRALIQHRLLRPEQASEIQQRVEERGASFVDELLASGAIGARELASFAAEAFGHPLLDLSAVDPLALSAAPTDLRLAAEARVVVLGRWAGRISVALSDPTDLPLLDRIRIATQASVDAVVVEHDKLLQLAEHFGESSPGEADELAIDHALAGRHAALDSHGAGTAAGVDSGAEARTDGRAEAGAGGRTDGRAEAASRMKFSAGIESGAEAEAAAYADDPVAARFLEKILLDAIAADASALHFEAFDRFCRIRFRVGGELREIAQPSPAMHAALAARIGRLCRLVPAGRRAPQEGRANLALPGDRNAEIRVSTLPTRFGGKITVRICNPFPERPDFKALGYEPDQQAALLEAIGRREGMVLVAGQVGSGRSLSLYGCLEILNEAGADVATIEDAIGIPLPGVHQVDLREQGLDPAEALRALLRHDSESLAVDELRDRETAALALEAASAGHLVISALQARSAPAALSRLAALGLSSPDIASSVRLLTAQHLVRRLCSCMQPLEIAPEELRRAGFRDEDLDGSWTPFRPVGCRQCEGRGYKGRVGVYEVLPISDEMREIVLAAGTMREIEAQARREGVRDLRRSGLLKVMRGETSIEEVLKRAV